MPVCRNTNGQISCEWDLEEAVIVGLL